MYTQTHLRIQNWYKIHGRTELPWRVTKDPYHIYLSEVMLQQTQVKTVLERYYFPFLQKFPTLTALGNAKLDDVLKMWEGLGYYNRAKNLHKTAQILIQESELPLIQGQTHRSVPTLPSDINSLIKFPGIGKNTAHAVAAFAYKKPVPIMEANVKRILCRLHKLKTPKDNTLWEFAYIMIDKVNPFDYNQAMMDIGASICSPKNPKCHLCPFTDICKGKNDPTLYPTKKKRSVPTREQTILLSLYDDKLSLIQRTGKFLHGLWGFASVEVPSCASEYIGEVSHAYTHFKLTCKIYVYYENTPEQAHYYSVEEIKKLAISKVDDKILKLYLDIICDNA